MLEAQRCQVSSCLFLPVFTSPQRDRAAAVLEIIQSEPNAVFPALLDWAKVCLEGAGLCTTEVHKNALADGLRAFKPQFEASAFESKVEQLPQVVSTALGTNRAGLNAESGNGATAVSAPMPPPGVPAQKQAVAVPGLAPNGADTFGGNILNSLPRKKIVQVGNSLVLCSDAAAATQR